MKQLTPRGYALFLLKLRDRSVGEIEEKMKQKGFLEADVAETVAFLLEKNFLNDERFAREYVRQRLLARPQGAHLLRQKLYEKHLNKALIELVLSEISSESERDSAEELGQKWIASHERVPKEERWGKLGSFLTRRGYDYDKIKSVLSELLNDKQY